MTPSKSDKDDRNPKATPGAPAVHPHSNAHGASKPAEPTIAPRPSRETLERAENEGMIAPPTKE